MKDLFGNEIQPLKPSPKIQHRNRRPLKNVKNNVLPHTQAKLDLYEGYLNEYISVLQGAPAISRIHLYDVFCGNGIYDDGKKGSPLVALDCLKKIKADLMQKGKGFKPVTLTVNDSDPSRFQNVKNLLTNENGATCVLDCRNLDADVMMTKLISELAQRRGNEKNLVLIDPYGYKNIRLSTIEKLMENGHTEVIMFLPIAQIHRFSQYAQNNPDNPYYQALRNFVNDFLPDYDFDVKPTAARVFQFMNCITNSMTFGGKYYACNYYIQRDGFGNYYGIFFLTNNIYGLDKMLQAKWKQDEQHGQGFRIQTTLGGLFDDHEEIQNKEKHQAVIRQLIQAVLNDSTLTNNHTMYVEILRNGYLPKHANPIIENMRKEGTVIMEYSITPPKGRFPTYIGWDEYSKNAPKVIFKTM